MLDSLMKGRAFDANRVAGEFGAYPLGKGNFAVPVADYLDAMVARGFGWHLTVGALTTPIVGGGAGTTIDATKPELCINIPRGFALRPLRIAVEAQLGIQTTDSHESEILIAVDPRAQNLTAKSAGSNTREFPINMRTDLAALTGDTSGCPCDCYSANTAALTSPNLDMELARKQGLTDAQGTAATLNVYIFDLVYEPRTPPYIIGPAALYVYWAGNIAVSAFAQASFLAIPSALITGLE